MELSVFSGSLLLPDSWNERPEIPKSPPAKRRALSFVRELTSRIQRNQDITFNAVTPRQEPSLGEDRKGLLRFAARNPKHRTTVSGSVGATLETITEWNASESARKSELQQAMAEEVLSLLDFKGSERILDVEQWLGQPTTEDGRYLMH